MAKNEKESPDLEEVWREVCSLLAIEWDEHGFKTILEQYEKMFILQNNPRSQPPFGTIRVEEGKYLKTFNQYLLSLKELERHKALLVHADRDRTYEAILLDNTAIQQSRKSWMNTMKAKWDGDGIFSSKDWKQKANKFHGDDILSPAWILFMRKECQSLDESAPSKPTKKVDLRATSTAGGEGVGNETGVVVEEEEYEELRALQNAMVTFSVASVQLNLDNNIDRNDIQLNHVKAEFDYFKEVSKVPSLCAISSKAGSYNGSKPSSNQSKTSSCFLCGSYDHLCKDCDQEKRITSLFQEKKVTEMNVASLYRLVKRYYKFLEEKYATAPAQSF